MNIFRLSFFTLPFPYFMELYFVVVCKVFVCDVCSHFIYPQAASTFSLYGMVLYYQWWFVHAMLQSKGIVDAIRGNEENCFACMRIGNAFIWRWTRKHLTPITETIIIKTIYAHTHTLIPILNSHQNHKLHFMLCHGLRVEEQPTNPAIAAILASRQT